MNVRPGELFPLDSALRGIRERFSDAVIDADRTSLRERTVVVPAARLAEVARAVSEEWGGAFVTLFGLDERAVHGRFRLHVSFSMAPEDAVLTLIAAVPGDAARYPAVSAQLPAAAWCERELYDLLGVEPADHPDPRPLVAHDGWPAGTHPLQKQFHVPEEWPWAPSFRVPGVEGDGVFEIPVGPVYGGIIEPGHFRFSSVGESVLALDVKLGWTWRGLEKLAEGATLDRGLQLAERICGSCAFAHALAWCKAVEELAGIPVPPRGRALRTVAAELERIANHLADLSGVANDVAYVVGAAEFARWKEVVHQLADALFGHRWLRGVCVPGGVRSDLDDSQQQWLHTVLAEVRAGVGLTSRALLANAAVLDRLVGTGVLRQAVARDLGATGPAARASGLDRDVRRDHPYAFYKELDFQVIRREAGDVRARFEVKTDEIYESMNLIGQLVLRMPGGPLAQHLGAMPSERWGFAMVESPRGLLSHWLRLGKSGAIADWRVRSASHALWPAVAQAVPGNIVPDFPLINKSFNLCYACTDK
ncbi:MAG TPA: NADH-quinone oxidoreductase subunit C [Candidatus Eisenbacteria bacterium]